MQFVGIELVKIKRARQQKPKQLKIDPALPGYPVDAELKPISDEKMDAIAWNLASKRVKSMAHAEELLLGELAKKRKYAQSKKQKS